MEDQEKNYQNKKKGITIVVFMSKESYRKVWEGGDSREWNVILSSQNNGKITIQIFWGIQENIIDTLHSCDKGVYWVQLTRAKSCRKVRKGC